MVKNFLNIIKYLVLGFVALPCLCELAFAEEEAFVLDGLRFDCQACETQGKGQCFEPKTKELIACSELKNSLLKNAISSEVLPPIPKRTELYRYLLTKEQVGMKPLLAFELFLRHAKEHPLTEAELRALFDAHAEVILELIKNAKVSTEVMQMLWQLPVELSPKFRANLIAMHPKLSVRDLVIELKGLPHPAALAHLHEYFEVLKLQGNPEMELVKDVIIKVQDCSRAKAPKILIEKCIRPAILVSESEPAIVGFLQNAMFRAVTESAKESSKKVRYQMAKAMYEKSNVKRSYERLLALVQTEKKLWCAPVRRVFKRYAKLELLNELQEATGCGTTKGSFRADFLLVLAALGAVFVYFMKYREQETFEGDAQSIKDPSDGELVSLLLFFGLPHDATERQLSEKYRLLAKELHPDAGGSSQVEKFSQLTERYQRAKQLLSKRS